MYPLHKLHIRFHKITVHWTCVAFNFFPQLFFFFHWGCPYYYVFGNSSVITPLQYNVRYTGSYCHISNNNRHKYNSYIKFAEWSQSLTKARNVGSTWYYDSTEIHKVRLPKVHWSNEEMGIHLPSYLSLNVVFNIIWELFRAAIVPL